MDMNFELSASYVIDSGVHIHVADLAYGLRRGYLRAQDVVDLAEYEVYRRDHECGLQDEVLARLALLLRDETAGVVEVLLQRNTGHDNNVGPTPARKWLYLQLKAAYETRDRLPDPLAVVEQLYADFDYPQDMSHLVGYMPAAAGAELGAEALMRQWRAYLDRERVALSTT